jgi:hypothetical protein
MWDHEFESTFLQQRVCELSVPERKLAAFRDIFCKHFVRYGRINLHHWSGHQLPGARDVGLAAGAGQQPVVADPMKPLR